jgi:hypothetical protein
MYFPEIRGIGLDFLVQRGHKRLVFVNKGKIYCLTEELLGLQEDLCPFICSISVH